MTWSWFELHYLALSPLHIGFHKFGLVQRTRTYIPGRALWGAFVNRFVLANFAGSSPPDYKRAGEWLEENVRFSYFFPYLEDESTPLLPWFDPDRGGFYFGYRSGNSPPYSLTAEQFERCFIHILGQTAISPDTNTATAASLHETEFLAHKVRTPGSGQVRRVFFIGYVGIKKTNRVNPDLWSPWREITVGGDRGYGYGRLRLSSNPRPLKEGQAPFSLPGASITDPGAVHWPEKLPLPAHVEISPDLSMAGDVEPLVGRETTPGDDSRKFGQKISPVTKCWVPGSVLLEPLPESTRFSIDPLGIWKLNPHKG